MADEPELDRMLHDPELRKAIMTGEGSREAGARLAEFRDRVEHVLFDFRDGLLDGVEEGVDAILELVPQWQPIGTAPKDGTHILLLYRFARGERRVAEGWWSTHSKCWNAIGDPMVRATHWMPLIELPQ